MSDYTSKSKLIDSIVQDVVITTEEGLDLRNEIIELIKNKPTVDEKEIIRKPMECILKRLRQKEELDSVAHVKGSQEEMLMEGYVKGIKKTIEIIKEKSMKE